MGKHSDNLDKKFRMKNQENAISKDNSKYSNQAYRPDKDLIITGEEFMVLRQMLQEVRGKRVIRVIDNTGKGIGQGLSELDFDIENTFAYTEKIHRRLVDLGLSVSIDVLRKEHIELQEQQKKDLVLAELQNRTEQKDDKQTDLEVTEVETPAPEEVPNETDAIAPKENPVLPVPTDEEEKGLSTSAQKGKIIKLKPE